MPRLQKHSQVSGSYESKGRYEGKIFDFRNFKYQLCVLFRSQLSTHFNKKEREKRNNRNKKISPGSPNDIPARRQMVPTLSVILRKSSKALHLSILRALQTPDYCFISPCRFTYMLQLLIDICFKAIISPATLLY